MKQAINILRPIALTVTAAATVYLAGVTALGLSPWHAAVLAVGSVLVVGAYVYGEYRGARRMAELLARRDLYEVGESE